MYSLTRARGLDLDLALCPKDFLVEPFIFISCDTLVKERISTTHNWVGYANTGKQVIQNFSIRQQKSQISF